MLHLPLCHSIKLQENVILLISLFYAMLVLENFFIFIYPDCLLNRLIS